MQFKPKSEEEMQKERLLPAGDYDCEVMDAEDMVSRNTQQDMIKVTLKVFGENGERTVFDYLTAGMLYKMRHFCYSIGIGASYEAGSVNGPECIGRTGRVKLRIETQPGYQPKNAVADYVVPALVKDASSAAKTLPAPALKSAAAIGAAGAATDEPPF